MDNNLPTGFISVDEAIKLINEDSRTDAKVDTKFLVSGLPYLRVGGTYNIRLMKHQDGKAVRNGLSPANMSERCLNTPSWSITKRCLGT